MAKDVVKQWLGQHRYPVLPEAEVIRLARIVKNEQCPTKRRRAINKLVKHNLRLVPQLVCKYAMSRAKIGIDDDRLSDYLQHAAIGLVRAAEKFDPERGYKFSTYAYRWIRQAIGRYHYTTYSVIRVPEHVLCPLMNGSRDVKYYYEAKRALNVDYLDRPLGSDQGETFTVGDLAAEQAVW